MPVMARFFIAAVMSVSIFILPISAHEGATGVVKERMDLMTSIGQTMKALSAMVRTPAQFDQKALIEAASQLSRKSERMLTLFPEGSMTPLSEASAEIWARPAEFAAIAKALDNEARKLIDVSRNGTREDLAAQFLAIGKTCSDCHKSFRVKKHNH